MKKLILLLTVLLFINCTTEETEETIDITGKWKLIEKYEDSGNNNSVWYSAINEEIYYYYFFDNGTYKKSLPQNVSNFTEGTYSIVSIENDRYTLKMSNNGVIDGRIVYFSESNLIIVGGCPEYCADKFIKVK